MRNNTLPTTDREVISNTQEDSSDNPTGESILSRNNRQPVNPPSTNTNPAVDGYYESLTSRNNSLKILMWILGFAIPIALGLIGYYLSTLREPIIRLEEGVSTIKEQVNKNSDSIDELFKYVYTNRQNPNQQNPVPTPPQK